VRYEEFIKACRRKALEKGMKASCSHWEIFYFLSKFMSNPRLDQNRLNWIPNDVKISKKGDLLLFIGCLPYFDVVFKDVNVRSLDIATSMLRILNKAGIKPALLSNERCCGHDSFLMGDLENFQALAKLNVEAIEEAEVKKVVTTCPECYQTLKVEYAKFFKTNFEVLQSSELIADLMDKGKLKLSPLEEKVTYLDPCRLGRYMGIYEQPRRVIKKIPKIELVEVRRSRENALCCGVTAWICSKVSRQVQTKLLNEAKEIGAKTLITACPKCQIHLSCTLNEKAMETYRNLLRISDLTTFVNNLVK
jgi:Fe-S oxidoreductase